ncbi:Armadillo-type fold [Pseudocohnilembus persalinus]|uniref:Armadillo-type fold n=1 Tax=Pseudocohnilembus persalinus TaxID=266149 RepID=A0A0V0Q8A4_PSEPJ|nr:Armadillo-type fold [Pseudocohnilembus persalinus]|eukprot:KRW98379.1 Armadillo-type fold [Pseudocohnilembus persalinus]
MFDQQLLTSYLVKLHSNNFHETASIIDGLSSILLDEKLTVEEISLCNSLIFNSKFKLFSFICEHVKEKDNLQSSMRASLYKLLGRYIKLRSQHILEYIQVIYEKCFELFKQDEQSRSKSFCLKPIIKIILYINNYDIVQHIIQPSQLASHLLNEIKFLKPLANVKAYIWKLLGVIVNKFSAELSNDMKTEIQEQCVSQLSTQMESKKPETNTIVGIFKSLKYSLNICYLTIDQLNKLYTHIILGITQIQDIKVYKVINASLQLLETQTQAFSEQMKRQPKKIFDNLMILIRHKNRVVKQNASQALESFMLHISRALDQGIDQHEQTFRYMMKTMYDLLQEQKNQINYRYQDQQELVSITVIIRAVGIFSQAIMQILGEDQLHLFFEELILLSEKKILKIFQMQDAQYQSEFQTADEMYTRNQDLIYISMDDYYETLRNSAELWFNIFNRQNIWTESNLKIFGESFFTNINELLQKCQLEYEIQYQNQIEYAEESKENKMGEEEETENEEMQIQQIFGNNNTIQYIPKNPDDMQFFYRVVLLLDYIIPRIKESIFWQWIPIFYKNIITKIKQIPRSLHLLKFIKTLNQFVINNDIFQYLTSKEKLEFILLLKNYFQELYFLQKKYQDELLIDSLKVLLTVPRAIIMAENYSFFKNHLIVVIKRSLQLGESNTSLGFLALKCLERLHQKCKQQLVNQYFKLVVPQLNAYLLQSKQQGKSASDQQNQQQSLDKIELFNLTLDELQLNKRTLVQEAYKFLGSIGGSTHMLIEDEYKGSIPHLNTYVAKELNDLDSQKMDLIAWDYETKVELEIPLQQQKIKINLTKLLPRLIQIAQYHNENKMKNLACEQLHAIVMWFAHTQIHESPQVAVLLDCLIESISSKDNNNLREFSASIIGELIKWTIKTKKQKEQLILSTSNIDMTFRRIQSLASNPDSYKKYGALLALQECIKQIQVQDILIEKYIFEQADTTLKISKRQLINKKQHFTKIIFLLKSRFNKGNQKDASTSQFQNN